MNNIVVLNVDGGEELTQSTVDTEDSGAGKDTCKETGVKLPDTVWGFLMIEKMGQRPDEKWKCLWCQQSFKKWNATKAIRHITKSGKDIKPCPAAIDKASMAKYMKFRLSTDSFRMHRKQAEDDLQSQVAAGQKSLAAMLDNRKRAPGSTSVSSSNPSFKSTTIDGAAQSQLTMAIADFVYSCGE